MPLVTLATRIRSPRRATPLAIAARAGAPLAAMLLTVLLGPPAAAGAAPTLGPTGAWAAPSPSPTVAPGATGGAARWAVQPSGPKGPTGRNYFIYDLAPGSTITDQVGVTNLSDRPLTFAVYGTDAYTTTDGAFALLPSDQPATDVGTWISVDRQSWTVPPGKRQDIPFRLSVPPNATPGDHAGGVIAGIAQVGVTADGQQVRLDQRVAARVYLRVAGEIHPAVTVESVRVGYDTPINPAGRADMTVTYRIRNSGNVRIGGTGAVIVNGPVGWTLSRTTPIDLPELLPGAAFTVTERVVGVPPALRLTATVDLAPTTVDTALPPVQRAASVWALPWLLLAVLAAAVAWLYLRRYRRRRPVPAAAEPPAAEPSAAEPPPTGAAGQEAAAGAQ
ncbi:WxL protein peptidoglycan domain-containing protein [Rhizomonospora bruguierae]|uniref:WxL protein peptidoglycan domain-containing protein n=1 Tax=Rhizomonospora bruguierae TaxID=1581705 RepID=UPI001BCADD49|nr:DUF916 domain-containing protein [Micromonospora sp. NBRC 107566]